MYLKTQNFCVNPSLKVGCVKSVEPKNNNMLEYAAEKDLKLPQQFLLKQIK
jgi:hypothetical protein